MQLLICRCKRFGGKAFKFDNSEKSRQQQDRAAAKKELNLGDSANDAQKKEDLEVAASRFSFFNNPGLRIRFKRNSSLFWRGWATSWPICFAKFCPAKSAY